MATRTDGNVPVFGADHAFVVERRPADGRFLDLDGALPRVVTGLSPLDGVACTAGQLREIQCQIDDETGDESFAVVAGVTGATVVATLQQVVHASPEVERLLSRLSQVFGEARRMGYPDPFAFAARRQPGEEEQSSVRVKVQAIAWDRGGVSGDPCGGTSLWGLGIAR